MNIGGIGNTKALTGQITTVALLLILTGALAPFAIAAVTSSVNENGVLTVTSDADDPIRIWCSDGKVWVNGFAPSTGEVSCSTITKIVAMGGPGNNNMDLSGVTRASFPGLSDGEVQMWGEGGDDTMTGSEFGDHMHGGEGDDTQYGGAGNDTQHGGAGNDTQHGDDGNDMQLGDSGDDTQYGGAGNDTQHGNAGNDMQIGGDGNDMQIGGDGNDLQHGDAGNDSQHGGPGDDSQLGGPGDDSQLGEDGDDSQYGDEGNDLQVGDAGNDYQYGGTGNDRQLGNDGDDKQIGGDGDDYQFGGAGYDEQWGGAGDDEGDGGEDGDWHFLFFGSGDIVNDEAGNDTLDASEVTSDVTIDLDLQDVDQGVDSAGNTLRLKGQFENYIGSPFDDVVFMMPLDVPRNIDGGNHVTGDTLSFYAKNLPVTNDGKTITVEGFAPVTYANFETVNIKAAGVKEEPPQTPAFQVALNAGINLVSVPLADATARVGDGEYSKQPISHLSDLLDALGDSATLITYYDVTRERFMSYTRSIPEDSPANTKVRGDMGLIVHMVEPQHVTFRGDAWPDTMDLAGGVNMIGLPVDSGVSKVSDLATEMGDNALLIVSYDPGTERFRSYIADAPQTDVDIAGDTGLIVMLKEEQNLTLSGEAWSNAPE